MYTNKKRGKKQKKNKNIVYLSNEEVNNWDEKETKNDM